MRKLAQCISTLALTVGLLSGTVHAAAAPQALDGWKLSSSVVKTGDDSARGSVRSEARKVRVSTGAGGGSSSGAGARTGSGTRRVTDTGAGSGTARLVATHTETGRRVEVSGLETMRLVEAGPDYLTGRRSAYGDAAEAGLQNAPLGDYTLSDGRTLTKSSSPGIGPDAQVLVVDGEPATAGQEGLSTEGSGGVDVVALAESAAADLALPQQSFQVGPPASLNEWNMNAVGQDLWLWLDDPIPSPHHHQRVRR